MGASPRRDVLEREISMDISHMDMTVIQALVALIFGVLILMAPRLLNYLVAIYFIFIGVVGLWPHVFGTPILH